MRIATLPGVFRPISDSRLLADCMRQELAPGASVADVCTGSGALAVAAAMQGAGEVTAIDVSRRPVLSVRLNARLNGVSVRALRGDLLAPVGRERFALIVSNPPYVPADSDALPRRGAARAWEAGRNGRALLDRLCKEAPAHLRPGGCAAPRALLGVRGGGHARAPARTRPGGRGDRPPYRATRAAPGCTGA